MPISDKEKNREYQKEWARKKRSSFSKEDHKKYLEKKRAWRKARFARGNFNERVANKRYRLKNLERIKTRDLKYDYGEFWEAAIAWRKLNWFIWNDPRFIEAIKYIRTEHERTDRRRVKKPFVGNNA